MSVLAEDPPNPSPHAPPGTTPMFSDWISWAKYLGMVAGILGLAGCSIAMVVGHRRHHQLAAEGANGVIWVIAGLSLLVLSPGLVTSIV